MLCQIVHLPSDGIPTMPTLSWLILPHLLNPFWSVGHGYLGSGYESDGTQSVRREHSVENQNSGCVLRLSCWYQRVHRRPWDALLTITTTTTQTNHSGQTCWSRCALQPKAEQWLSAPNDPAFWLPASMGLLVELLQ